MFGWTKREKNEKSQNKAVAELKKLSLKERGAKLSRLRRRYPNRAKKSYGWDFVDQFYDYESILLWLLIADDLAVNEADLFDNPVEDTVEEVVEVAVVAEVVEEVVETEAVETTSFDSSTPVESILTESTPETIGFDSNTNTSSYGSSEDSGSSYDSGDSGGGSDD